MKTQRIVTIILLAMSTVFCQSIPKNGIWFDGKLNTPYIFKDGGVAYLQISLKTGSFDLKNDRKPMNLSVVIDRSGSMEDEHKMEYVKKAFSRLIEQLDARDILSVVIYDDQIDVLRTAQRVGNGKRAIIRLLDEVYPRNSTNLGGGLLEGLHQAEQNSRKEFVNRVILLSDGLANAGITDPVELNTLARKFRNKGISISTMGVGLDYNENLMMGLSESGGGNYYFIEHPNMLTALVTKELHSASSVVAQNVNIHLKLGKDVRVKDVIGCESNSSHEVTTISVGDLYANDMREYTVELEIPKGNNSFVAARGYLEYESELITGATPTFAVTVQYTNDYAIIDQHRDMESQAKADVAVSTRSVDRAMKALDEGNQAAADAEMRTAESAVSTSQAAGASGEAGAAIEEQKARILQYQSILKDEQDARKAKKSIQYDNYKTQKKK